MAIEVFAGTLDRYYSDVESAEEAARTHEIVTHWIDTIIAAVKKAAPEAEAWEERADKECVVVQMDELHYGALLYYAACMAYNVKPREAIYPDWKAEEEQPVQNAHADPNMPWSLMKGASWWLPTQTPVLLRGEVPTGDVVTISSCGALLLELLRVNEMGWKADESVVLSWFESEGQMAEGAKRYSTESMAKYAFSALWQLAKYGLQNHVPVIMDAVEEEA